MVDEVAGLDTADAVLGHAGRQLHPSAFHHGEDDGGGLELVLQLVEGLAQGLGVGAIELRCKYLEAADIDRLDDELVALRGRQPALQRRELLLELPNLIEHLADPRRHLGRRRFQGPRKALHGAFERLKIGQRVVAGHGLDPAHPRRDAALGDDLEEADVAGALHMGAAAELAARADVEDADLIAVLLAK